MPTATIAGHEVQINDEGFLTEYDQWSEDIAEELATNIGVEMTPRHWEVIKWLREDYKEKGETATTRRVQTVGGFPTKEQFQLFLALLELIRHHHASVEQAELFGEIWVLPPQAMTLAEAA